MFGRLARRGHEVSVLAAGWPGAPIREAVDGLDVHRTGGRYTFPWAARRYYRSRLRRTRIDVLIEDLNKVPLFTPLWAGEALVLLVHHLFGATAFTEAAFPVAAATWLLERPLGRVYGQVPVQAVSPSTAEDLVRRGFHDDQITVIPNGVDADHYAPDPSTPRFAQPTVLYLGRLKRYKRIDLILEALAIVRSRGIAARLIIAGTSNAGPELERLASRLGLGEGVEFRGFVDEEEKRRLYRRAWVHVLTSEKEGWGITNLEAGGCGTPTVASDSPGLRDSVRHGETGLLVPHGDVGALADGLARVLTDHALRERLGEQARAFAVHLSWDRAADRTEAHLRLIAEAATGRAI